MINPVPDLRLDLALRAALRQWQDRRDCDFLACVFQRWAEERDWIAAVTAAVRSRKSLSP